MGHPDWEPGFTEVWDFRFTDAYDFPPSDAQALRTLEAEIAEELEGSKTVIITTGRVAFAYAGEFYALLVGREGRDVVACETVNDALREISAPSIPTLPAS